jgi:hypothetical protein
MKAQGDESKGPTSRKEREKWGTRRGATQEQSVRLRSDSHPALAALGCGAGVEQGGGLAHEISDFFGLRKHGEMAAGHGQGFRAQPWT